MKNVVVFTTKPAPTAPRQGVFAENKIHYIEKDVNVDAEARNEMDAEEYSRCSSISYR